MKIECRADKIKHELSLAERVTGKNLSLPVLNTILFDTKNKKLVLRATNLEVGVEIEVPAKVYKEGSVAVSGNIITGFLNTIQNEETVKLEVVGGNLSVSTQKNTALIKTNKTEDFPLIPKPNKTTTKINTQDLVKGLKAVWFSASTSDIKPEISSVLVYSENKKLVFVATDSFRLAEKKIPYKEKDIKPILIPHKNVIEIIRFFEEKTEDVEISLSRNQLSIRSDNTYFTSRLTDGIYPNYKQIISNQHKTQAIILRNELVSILKTANIFMDDFNRVTLKIIPNENLMEIEAKNTNVGENTSNIEANLEGESVSVGFNYKYMSDVFNIIGEDSICLRLNGVGKPIIVSGVGNDMFLYLVMPVNR